MMMMMIIIIMIIIIIITLTIHILQQLLNHKASIATVFSENGFRPVPQ